MSSFSTKGDMCYKGSRDRESADDSVGISVLNFFLTATPASRNGSSLKVASTSGPLSFTTIDGEERQ